MYVLRARVDLRTLTSPLPTFSEVPEAVCGGVAGTARASRLGKAQVSSIYRGLHP